jgi:hypothetical protein
MPATELDDFLEIAAMVNERVKPVKYHVHWTEAPRSGPITVSEPTFDVARIDGTQPSRQVFRGTEPETRAYLVGLAEGVCGALRRW